MIVKSRPLADISQQAINVLFRELGAADAIRFLNQFRAGQGNYTAEREGLFRDLTLDQILSEIAESDPGKPSLLS